MKCLGKIALCLAGGLVLNTGLRAENSILPANPYATIVVRNVFGLNPPKPVEEAPPGDPPPKITPNGIMSIFGQLQVLFKVAPPAGVPNAKEQSYVLSEGQGQDDIEVTAINEKAGLITFNNHGTVQQIPLANAPAVGAPASVPTQVAPTPTFPRPFGGPGRLGGRPGGPGGLLGGGSSTTQNRASGGGMNSSLGGGGYGGGYAGQAGQASQQPQGVPTPEEQAILLEVQREQWKQQGNAAASIIPPLLPPETTAQ